MNTAGEFKMATVIEFESKRKSSPQHPLVLNGPAQILIFNGVRFERLDVQNTAPENLTQDDSRRNRAS
jgi:hypothetical protein